MKRRQTTTELTKLTRYLNPARRGTLAVINQRSNVTSVGLRDLKGYKYLKWIHLPTCQC